MKKYSAWLASAAVVVLIVLFTIWLVQLGKVPSPERSFSPLFDPDGRAVLSVTMLNGNNGEIRYTKDVQIIGEVVAWLNSLQKLEQLDQRPRAGYLYWMDLELDGGETIRFTFTSQAVSLENTYYDLNRNIQAELDHQYSLLDPKK